MIEQVRDSTLHEVVRRYCAAWNESGATLRYEMLRGVWSSGGVYVDPTVQVSGIHSLVAYIGVAMARNPGSKIAMTSGVDAHHGQIRFGWSRIQEDGTPISGGIDFAELSEEGTLLRVIGFLGDLPPLTTA
jgi:hypothetical protein